jgi:hypothetical protein
MGRRPLGGKGIMQPIKTSSPIQEWTATTEPVEKASVLQPLSKVLPTVSPIYDLLASTNALERSNRIYWAMYSTMLAILIAAVAVGFFGYIAVF